MKTLIGLTAALLTVGVACAADDSPEVPIKQQIEVLKEVTDILKSIKDKETAEAAKSKLDQLGEKQRKLSKEMEALAKLPKDKQEELKKKYGAMAEEAQQALEKEVGRVGKLSVAVKAIVEDTTLFKDLAKAKRDLAKYQIETLNIVVEAYKLRHAKYPVSLEVLAQKPPDGKPAMVKPEALIDPWGRPYEYNPAGERNKSIKPDIWSLGPNPDNKEGIIGNWPEKKDKK